MTHNVNHKKDYAQWHELKTNLNNRAKSGPLYFYEKDIWWTSVGFNIRFEEDGKGEKFVRPVLILRKFNQFFFLGVPLSTTAKRGNYYYPFTYKNGVVSTALLSQLRSYDAKRLVYKMGTITLQDYKGIQRKLTEIINETAQK